MARPLTRAGSPLIRRRAAHPGEAQRTPRGSAQTSQVWTGAEGGYSQTCEVCNGITARMAAPLHTAAAPLTSGHPRRAGAPADRRTGRCGRRSPLVTRPSIPTRRLTGAGGAIGDAGAVRHRWRRGVAGRAVALATDGGCAGRAVLVGIAGWGCGSRG